LFYNIYCGIILNIKPLFEKAGLFKMGNRMFRVNIPVVYKVIIYGVQTRLKMNTAWEVL